MAQSYQSNIPSLAAITNHIAANNLRYARAPGIVQGQNIDPENYDAAINEANILRSYSLRFPNEVTAEEIRLAFDRANAISIEHMTASYPQVIAPAGLNNALITALNTALTPIQTRMNAMQNAMEVNQNETRDAMTDMTDMLNTMQGTLNAMQDEMANNHDATMSAIQEISNSLENEKNKRRNKTILEYDEHDSLLIPLRKERAGLGPGLPGVCNVQIQPADVVALGASMNVPPFPSTIGDLRELTGEQLSRLSALYNDNFDIIARDNMEVRKRKFERFIS